MDEITDKEFVLTFNGSLEAGVRAVAILGEAFPRSFEIQQLIAFDYLLVRTSQLKGPSDLHPETPISHPATEVRRKVVQEALHLMMTRNLVCRVVKSNGIYYQAGEASAVFLDAFNTPYLMSLKYRAKWLVNHMKNHSEFEFTNLMKQSFDKWVIEFQNFDQSLGSKQ